MIGYNEYIGARYVPKFDGDWDNTKEYEPLIIVSYQGNSYTSKTFAPKNVDITNETYWACTGNYNAQVEAYRQEVLRYANLVGNLDNLDTVDKTSIINSINETFNTIGKINVKAYGAKGDGITDDTEAFTIALSEAITSHKPLYIPVGTYIISDDLNCYTASVIGDNQRNSILKFTDGHLKIGHFGMYYRDFQIELDNNNPDTVALECYYLTDGTSISDVTVTNGLVTITKSWYFSFNNVNISGGNKGAGLTLFGTTDEGGVNAGNFSGLFIDNVTNGILIDGTNYACEANIFKSITIEACTEEAVKVVSNLVSTTNIIGLYVEDSTADTESIICSNNSTSYIIFENVMFRGNPTSDHLFNGNTLLINGISGSNSKKLSNDGKCFSIATSNITNTLPLVAIEITSETVTPQASGMTNLGIKAGYHLIKAYNSDGYNITNMWINQYSQNFGMMYHYGTIDTSETEKTLTCVWLKTS